MDEMNIYISTARLIFRTTGNIFIQKKTKGPLLKTTNRARHLGLGLLIESQMPIILPRYTFRTLPRVIRLWRIDPRYFYHRYCNRSYDIVTVM